MVRAEVASGALEEATARQARWLRAFDRLPKLFLCPELVSLVRAAIASRKACRALLRSPSATRRALPPPKRIIMQGP